MPTAFALIFVRLGRAVGLACWPLFPHRGFTFEELLQRSIAIEYVFGGVGENGEELVVVGSGGGGTGVGEFERGVEGGGVGGHAVSTY